MMIIHGHNEWLVPGTEVARGNRLVMMADVAISLSVEEDANYRVYEWLNSSPRVSSGPIVIVGAQRAGSA